MNGTIKRLNAEKGYGFIESAAVAGDLYFKIPAGGGFAEGAEVSFETAAADNDKTKLKAINVTLGHAAPVVDSRRSASAEQAYSRYYLPADTAELLFVTADGKIDNVALKIQKYLPVPKDATKLIVKPEKPARDFSKAVKDLLKTVTDAQLDLLRSYKLKHSMTAKLGSRMVVGLGSADVHETAITLHHTYGCPYVPGSSVKGCLRSFVIRDLFGGDETAAMGDKGFVTAFGTQENGGKIAFLDAFPRTFDRLDIDIMNPHFAQYYTGATTQNTVPPSDDDSPNPIRFYAVPAKTEFVFRLVSRTVDPKTSEIKGVKLTDLLADTLQDMGIGSKTAVGYGWFSNLEVSNG